MKAFLRFSYVFLAVAILVTFIFSCTKLASDTDVNDSSVEESSASPESSEDTTEESSVDTTEEVDSSEETTEDSSVETTEDTTEDSSSEDTTEESSEPDESSAPVGGGSDPVTPEPSKITSSELDSYFNDSIFVGHSVMVHFSNAVSSWEESLDDKGVLGNATFCCASSFSCYNNLNKSPDDDYDSDDPNPFPRYRGEYYHIEDLPEVTGRKRIFLGLMGLNDLGVVGKADTCSKLVTDEVIECIELIKEKCPDAEVVILSATYLTRDRSYTNLNNRNMSLLNKYVLEYCNENGIDFIDVASILCDGDGYLASVYSRDAYCHLTKDAYIHWMTQLRDYAAKKNAGTWKNPTDMKVFGE